MDEVIDVSVQLLHETSSEWLVTYSIPEEAVWVPKSQCQLEESGHDGIYTLWIPEWLAVEKEIV